MKTTSKTLRTCENGHQYYKSSDCPACPICEKLQKTSVGFLSSLSNPARRALENQNIDTVKKLSRFTEAEILKLHGIGPASFPKLRAALAIENLSFNK